jgi:hypothetical protein
MDGPIRCSLLTHEEHLKMYVGHIKDGAPHAGHRLRTPDTDLHVEWSLFIIIV